MTIDLGWRRHFTNQRLPAPVFCTLKGQKLYIEYSRALTDQGWQLFHCLAQEYGDTRITCHSFDPDADSYYGRHIGVRAEFDFAAELSPNAYLSRVHDWPAGYPADTLAMRADALGWWGSSGQWACWGERECGICVILLSRTSDRYQGLVRELDAVIPILSLDEALHDVVDLRLNDEAMKLFRIELQSRYGG